MTMRISKNCGICGKEFTATQSNQKFCSVECRRINQKALQKQWEKDNRVHKNECRKTQQWYKAKLKEHTCNICGKPVEWTRFSRPVRHDECVLNEIVKSVNAGNKINDAQYQQLTARGYDIGMFREEFADVLENIPIVSGRNMCKKCTN